MQSAAMADSDTCAGTTRPGALLGLASSTAQSIASGLKRFNEWQASRNQPSVDELTAHDIEGDFLEDLLSLYSLELATLDLSEKTLLQYLSNAKERLYKRFPAHYGWNLGWYASLRLRLARQVKRRDMMKDPDDIIATGTLPFYIEAHPEFMRQKVRQAVMEGRPLADGSTYAIDGKTLCARLMRKCIGEPQLYQGPAQQRCWIVLTFFGVGRGGEIKLQHYNEWWWDLLFNNVDALWNESKTLSRQAMLFGPSKYSRDAFLCDFYHALATYFAVEYGLERSDIRDKRLWPYIFPQLRNMRVEVAAKLTKVLRDNVHPDMVASYSSRSMRKGMTTFLNANVTDSELEYRGGWGNGSNSKSYKEDNLSQSLPGMNAMGGWSDLKSVKVPPTLECLGDHTTAHVDSFVNALFGRVDLDIFKPGGRLHPILRACTASLIMYFKDVKRYFGISNRLIERMIVVAEQVGICDGSATDALDVLGIWCDKVKLRFQADNLDCPNPGDVHLSDQLHWQHKFNRSIVEKNGLLEEKCAELVASNERLERANRTLLRQQGDLMRNQEKIIALLLSSQRNQSAFPTSSSDQLTAFESAKMDDDGNLDDVSVASNGSSTANKRATVTPLQGNQMKKMRRNADAGGDGKSAGVSVGQLIRMLHASQQLRGKKERLRMLDVKQLDEQAKQRLVLELASMVISDAEWEILCSTKNESDVRKMTDGVNLLCLDMMERLEEPIGWVRPKGAKRRRYTTNFGGLGKRIRTLMSVENLERLSHSKKYIAILDEEAKTASRLLPEPIANRQSTFAACDVSMGATHSSANLSSTSLQMQLDSSPTVLVAEANATSLAPSTKPTVFNPYLKQPECASAGATEKPVGSQGKKAGKSKKGKRKTKGNEVAGTITNFFSPSAV